MKKLRHAGANYKMVLQFLDGADAAGGHRRYESAGFMPLVVENLRRKDYRGWDVYSVSHYGLQNGDLMADPDMQISVDRDAGMVEPLTFQNDYMGMFQEVYKERDGQMLYSQRLRIDLDDFLWHWLQNIQNQGFTAEKETV